MALGLLGGQVGGRAQHRPGPGQGRGGRRLGNAEIGHLHLPVLTNKHVGRLDVAVDQPLGVGGGQGRAHLDGQLDRPAGGQPALAVKQLGQALAGHVLHHQIGWSASEPLSNTATMLGWFNRAAARASRRNRSTNNGS